MPTATSAGACPDPLLEGPARNPELLRDPGAFSQIASGARRTHRPTGLPAAVTTPAAPVDSKEQMMASEQQLERSMLDGKDREELHAIAGAMGVKGITRLRKADLVDAILAAAAGQAGRGNGAKTSAKDSANGSADVKPKRAVRSKKASELAAPDSAIAALAAEEEAIASAGAEPEVAPAPARRATTAPAADARRDGRPPMTLRVGHHGRAARRLRGRTQLVRRGQPHRNAAPPSARSRPRWRAPGQRATARRWRRAARARVQRRADRDRGSARPARRGLRLPAHERVPPRSQRRVRVRVPGAALRAAQG